MSMRTGMVSLKTACMAAAIFLVPCLAQAAFDSGSTGADGAFEPAASTVLQIPESGVFNYTTVNIPSGVTVTFTKNTRNTPVTILATGNVTVNGTISVNGVNGNGTIGGSGGSGGFNGGAGGNAFHFGRRAEGPGSGDGGNYNGSYSCWGGVGGGFGTSGAAVNGHGGGGVTYGNERILPLIGGSGGGGGGGIGVSTYNGGAGGGGGGAILIASSGTLTINGTITANGGTGAAAVITYNNNTYACSGGGGSGGGIHLIANSINGIGTVTATGGSGGNTGNYNYSGGAGGVGRIRMDASDISLAATNPVFSQGYPVLPVNIPSLSISSIGGVGVPQGSKGSFGAPDIMLPFNTTTPVNVVVTGSNIPIGTTVTLTARPAIGSPATSTATLAGTDVTSTSASSSLNISFAYPTIISASVTFQLTSANGGPIYAAGERVDKIRVTSNLRGESNVTYITESGMEIPATI